jgi:sec-independent protein translocase protein TatA
VSAVPPLLPTLGVPELLVILVIVLLLFGAGKLPAVGRQLGKGLRQFRKAQREVDAVLNPDLDSLVRAEDEPAVEDAVEIRRRGP